MFRSLLVIVAGLTASWVSADSQQSLSSTYLRGSTEREIVAAAEQEAGVYPTSTRPPQRLKALFASPETPGTPDRRCVVGRGSGPLRSGEFVVGGELSGTDSPDPRKRAAPKIWWSPLHHQPKMELLVRARRVGADGEYRFVGVTVAHAATGPGAVIPEAEREYFFPSGIAFLHSGTWVLVATQGPDWGCFVLTMPSVAAV